MTPGRSKSFLLMRSNLTKSFVFFPTKTFNGVVCPQSRRTNAQNVPQSSAKSQMKKGTDTRTVRVGAGICPSSCSCLINNFDLRRFGYCHLFSCGCVPFVCQFSTVLVHTALISHSYKPLLLYCTISGHGDASTYYWRSQLLIHSPGAMERDFDRRLLLPELEAAPAAVSMPRRGCTPAATTAIDSHVPSLTYKGRFKVTVVDMQ